MTLLVLHSCALSEAGGKQPAMDEGLPVNEEGGCEVNHMNV